MKNKTITKKTHNVLLKSTRNLLQTMGGLVILFLLLTILSATGSLSYSFTNLLVQLCIYSIVAVALNLCVGYLGELSLGHAGFMSIGAFVSAIFTQASAEIIPSVGLRFFLALIIGTAVAALAGFLVGIPVLRLNGDYLAIVTLAFGEIIKGIINVLYVGKDQKGLHVALLSDKKMKLDETGKMLVDGAKGITGTPHVSNFTIGMILLLLTLVIVTFLVNSRSGRAIMAIRDNRIAAESVGIDITRFKMIAFTVSAAIAGVAGVLYSHYLASMTAIKFDFNMSILFLVFVVLGGLGNFRGSIISAVLLTLLPELLRGLASYRMLIYAILLIAMMLVNWAPAAIQWRETNLPQLKAKFCKKNKKEV